MSDEIKEILDNLKNIEDYLSFSEAKQIEDYITNLQEEVEDLREEDWAWHQILKIQNKREYRSKFLKEFQEEFGTNTFPDYDEIYKRYDKLKKENERLKEIAHKMHTWIFLHSNDEQEVYDELGLTKKENTMLGYSGQIKFNCSDKN